MKFCGYLTKSWEIPENRAGAGVAEAAPAAARAVVEAVAAAAAPPQAPASLAVALAARPARWRRLGPARLVAEAGRGAGRGAEAAGAHHGRHVAGPPCDGSELPRCLVSAQMWGLRAENITLLHTVHRTYEPQLSTRESESMSSCAHALIHTDIARITWETRGFNKLCRYS